MNFLFLVHLRFLFITLNPHSSLMIQEQMISPPFISNLDVKANADHFDPKFFFSFSHRKEEIAIPYQLRPSSSRQTHALQESIVEHENQISNFDARFELAKIYAHHPEFVQEAFVQFGILSKQKPHDPSLMLEISRYWMGQGKFSEAFEVLSLLFGRHDAAPDFSKQNHSSSSQDQPNSIARESESIVSVEDQIDDDHARHELALVLSYKDIHLNEALEQYLILLNKYPYDAPLILETSRIYLRLKKFHNALCLLYPAIQEHPENADLLIEAAHAEHALSHPKQTQELLMKVFALNKWSDSVSLDYANMLMLVGSFYQAEKIFRDLLKAKPESLDLSLNVAWSLASAERYEQAEGIYRQLLQIYPDYPKVLEALASLKILEKKFVEALEILSWLISLKPDEPSYILLEANAFYQNADYNNALKDFEQLLNHSKYAQQALIGMGKTYLKMCEDETARCYFQKASEIDPSSIAAEFYLAGIEVKDSDFIAQIIAKTTQPEDLIKWADHYAEEGMGGMILLYEAALQIDPDFFPAQIGLAQALSTHYQFDESIALYSSLLETFPNASKIMIAIARIYSWGKQYRCSFAWYDAVSRLNPEDPVPVLEKARVAYWGYFFDLSMSTYQRLLTPSVDELLFESLRDLNARINNENLAQSLDSISQSLNCDSHYTGYEKFTDELDALKDKVPSAEFNFIEAIVIEHHPKYRIQKSVLLEKTAKSLDWRNYFLHAIPVYEDLAVVSPGNLEGLYSLAQDFCSLGLCHRSRSLYNHILNISPNHSLVAMALERNLLKDHPLFLSNYSYWRERGLGQFSQSQIARHQFDEVYAWNPSCQFQLRFMQNVWIEHPLINNGYYPAEGQTIEVDRIFNRYVKGSAGATRKNYFQRFVSRYTGFANLWFNCYDFFNLGIGYEKKNEIYNLFSLKQGIQASIPWVSVLSNITHYWTMAATYRHYDYNDKNTMEHIEFLTSYAFSDDPNIFKIIVGGSYRNTAHDSRFVFNANGDLINVIHPYWTPLHYYSNRITLEFRHNYSFFNYCEAPQRYFDVKITAEEDTARNPSLQILFEWKHEFMYHCGFELKGLIHQSRLWNAEGAWFNVYYRF